MEIKQWYRAAELEEFPGLPSDARTITTKAKKENWQSRPRQGQGRGNEFYIDSLPEATRKYLYLEHVKQMQVDKDKQVEEVNINTAKLNTLKPFQQKKLDARLEVLNAYKSFKSFAGFGITKAREEFTKLYNSQKIEVSESTLEVIKTLSTKTLQRLELAGTNDLIVNYGNSSVSIIDKNPEIRDFILGMICEIPHIRVSHLIRMVKQEFTQVKVSSSSINRWLSKWKDKNESVYLSIANPDAHKNRFLPAQGSLSADYTRFNQLWELDSTPADVMTTDGRYSIVGAIDVFSRRVKVILSKTSDSDAVCRVMRKAILEWGMPEMIKTDNGKDYASKHFTNAMALLGIEQEFCRPYQGQEKPHIERFFGTMTRALFEMEKGYIGHNVEDRRAIESKKAFADRLGAKDEELYDVKMSKDELQEKMDEWIDNVYEQENHRSLGMSPWKKYTTCKAVTKIIKEPRQLDVLLSKSQIRTVSKKGISIDGVEYYGSKLALYIRKQVKCFYDNEDMGRLYVYDLEDHKFICVALNAENAGANLNEMAATAKRMKKAADAEGRKNIRKAKNSINPADVVKKLYQPNPTGNKAVAQKLEVEYVSDKLEEVGKSLRADDMPMTVAVDPVKFKQVVSIQEVVPKETAKQRFARWLIINNKKLAGESVTEEDNKFHRIYQTSVEFKTQIKIREASDNFELEIAAA